MSSIQPSPNPKTCLVTGGAGFIGSHIVEGLLDAGHRVRILDNLSTGSKANIAHLLGKAELLEGDIRDYDSVDEAMDGIDAVFHHAALTSVHQSIQDPYLTHTTNVGGLVNVLECARQHGTGKIIFASSAAVYGAGAEAPRTEDEMPSPISPYGMSKWVGELHCRSYTRHYPMQAVCLRYFNVYGPRQTPNSQYAGVISTFANTLMRRETPTIYGSGEQSRDFVSVLDIRDVNMLALEADTPGFSVFNVASGHANSINQVYQHLCHLTDHSPQPNRQPERRGDIRESLASIYLAKACLGFEPKISLASGLSEYVDSLKAAV